MKTIFTKTRIIILAVVVVLVVGISVGGYFIHRGMQEDSVMADVKNKTEKSSETEISTEEIPETEPMEEPEEEAVDPSTLLRHAPNMYVDWISNYSQYEAVTIDWKCTEDARDTYWAVHNWNGGYCGFQTLFTGKHTLILSLWDLPDGTHPSVEYSLSDTHGDFGGEGEGKKVYTDFDWEVGVWYSMKVEWLYENDKTYFTQYIKEDGGEWLKTACISYPVYFPPLGTTTVFQEDFGFNNLKRSCELRNAGGLVSDTDTWEMWTECTVCNTFFPTPEATWEDGVMKDVSFNCDFEKRGNVIWIQSGGYDDTPIPGNEFPQTVKIITTS